MRARQKRREAAAHVDDWLMTYADMITLLLCFFVLFVALSASRKERPHESPAPAAVAVTAPIPPQPAPPRPVLAEAAVAASRPPAAAMEASRAPAKAVAAPPADAPKEAEIAGLSAAELDAAASRTLAVVPPPELAGSVASPAPRLEPPKGDVVTTLEMGSAAFFDRGSAGLSEAGAAILRGLLPRLTAALAAGYRIKVEGHTDDTPIETAQYPSNWELSTARAAAVVHYFLAQGIPAERLRAVGYADTEPEAPNRDAAGNPIPENQAQNRRVVIRLEKIEAPPARRGA